jgi:hypothetical protein
MPDDSGHATAAELREQAAALQQLIEDAQQLQRQIAGHLDSLRRSETEDAAPGTRRPRRKSSRPRPPRQE